MKRREGAEAMVAQDIKAIIFDCFGVLYTDSKQSLLNVVPPERSRDLHDLFTANNYGAYGRQAYLEQVALITNMTEAQVSEYIAHEHRLNKELTTYITNRLRGEYQIGMLSNIGREWIESFFSQHQLHDLFDEVVLSGDEGMVKPNPAIFELAATRLGVQPSQCVMIDDVIENCNGAVDAGMTSIHYQNNDQLILEVEEVLGRKERLT